MPANGRWDLIRRLKVKQPFLQYINNQPNALYYPVFVCHYNRILALRTSSWRRPEFRPKDVGENFVNKIHNKYRNAFIGYLYIFISDCCTEDGIHAILKCVCYYLCLCTWYIKSVETPLLHGILCFTDKLLRVEAVMYLASEQYLQIWKYQSHSLPYIFKLLFINIWSCFRSTSKQTVEVMLPPVHATRHMCRTARTGIAALRLYLIVRRPVKFHRLSECTGKGKHLLPVPGI